MKLKVLRFFAACALTASTVSGFSLRAETRLPDHEEVDPVPELPDYLYLRCNATSWNVDKKSRLSPYLQEGVYSLVYEVKEPWMVQNHDDCTFTATPEKNAWGSYQLYFGVKNALVEAPGIASELSFSKQANVYFKVKYPKIGRYRAILNLNGQPFVMIVPAETSPDLIGIIPGTRTED